MQNDLEGVAAKRKSNVYLMCKETTDWVKFKNLKDDDFVVCGYAESGDYLVSWILGQYSGENLVYKVHVHLGKSSADLTLFPVWCRQESPRLPKTPKQLLFISVRILSVS